MPKVIRHPAISDTSKAETDGLPAHIARRTAAELVTRLYFPVSYRTIESWPLAVRRVNGKALYNTAGLLAYAREKLEAAPAIRGGRRSAA